MLMATDAVLYDAVSMLLKVCVGHGTIKPGRARFVVPKPNKTIAAYVHARAFNCGLDLCNIQLRSLNLYIILNNIPIPLCSYLVLAQFQIGLCRVENVGALRARVPVDVGVGVGVGAALLQSQAGGAGVRRLSKFVRVHVVLLFAPAPKDRILPLLLSVALPVLPLATLRLTGLVGLVRVRRGQKGQ
jgi:hypothetical protein